MVFILYKQLEYLLAGENGISYLGWKHTELRKPCEPAAATSKAEYSHVRESVKENPGGGRLAEQGRVRGQHWGKPFCSQKVSHRAHTLPADGVMLWLSGELTAQSRGVTQAR